MRFRRALFLVPALLLFAGCRDREVRSYRVPKEQPGTPALADAPGAPAAAAPALTWTAPAEWTEQPAGGFRRGSFTLPGAEGADADFSIIAFPGDAGGLVENLNRWRGQIGLPAFTEEEAQAALEHVDGAAGLHFHVVDFTGTVSGAPVRILGAVLPYGNESWFFKVMGPEPTVAAARPAFLQFLQTVKPAQP